MLIGYARVSTQDQNLELQREALTKAGCKKLFEGQSEWHTGRPAWFGQDAGNTARGQHSGRLEARLARPVCQAARGRKPKMTDSKIASAKKLLASGVPAKDVAKNLGVSVPTLYRWVPASAHA